MRKISLTPKTRGGQIGRLVAPITGGRAAKSTRESALLFDLAKTSMTIETKRGAAAQRFSDSNKLFVHGTGRDGSPPKWKAFRQWNTPGFFGSPVICGKLPGKANHQELNCFNGVLAAALHSVAFEGTL
jgi:hypothetical protein